MEPLQSSSSVTTIMDPAQGISDLYPGPKHSLGLLESLLSKTLASPLISALRAKTSFQPGGDHPPLKDSFEKLPSALPPTLISNFQKHSTELWQKGKGPKKNEDVSSIYYKHGLKRQNKITLILEWKEVRGAGEGMAGQTSSLPPSQLFPAEDSQTLAPVGGLPALLIGHALCGRDRNWMVLSGCADQGGRDCLGQQDGGIEDVTKPRGEGRSLVLHL
ncbi:uncharacterized protein LOC104871573 isoform X3 [Fukomys damarensis]|uniref:uncharacterized protein LOC104871573 isoform X3 n=1 Tax=Fukomys damarensis TaxID=885580 RepID=UPI0005403056|nr:uncharacterized protein LOC104871573 isoform X3 [Fukomys damarensis]